MKNNRRCGAVGVKLGMTRLFGADGNAIAVTLVKIDDNFVINHKTIERDNYNALLIGYDKKHKNRISKPILGIGKKAGVDGISKIVEFRISDNNFVDIGTKIDANHFSIGQSIDVRGKTIGKGFQGVMKRHNFGGGEASHGTSVAHRSHGATGQRQDPGKVFKGKKMAGHMGDVNISAQNLTIVAVYQDLNVIAIKGCVPGSKNARLLITDAIKQ